MDDERESSRAIAHELAHAEQADAETASEAFAELDALIARARSHLVSGGWLARAEPM